MKGGLGTTLRFFATPTLRLGIDGDAAPDKRLAAKSCSPLFSHIPSVSLALPCRRRIAGTLGPALL